MQLKGPLLFYFLNFYENYELTNVDLILGHALAKFMD